MDRKRWKQTAIMGLLVAGLAAPALSQTGTGWLMINLPGVDESGNLSTNFNYSGYAKVYALQNGTVLEVGFGLVQNASGSAATFNDVGFPIDYNGTTTTSTNDYYNVGRPLRFGRFGGGRAFATLVAVATPTL
jgi:hypothetical protein